MFDGRRDALLFVVDTIASERLRVPRRLALGELELLISRRGDDRDDVCYPRYTFTEEMELFIVGSLRHNSSKGEPVLWMLCEGRTENWLECLSLVSMISMSRDDRVFSISGFHEIV